MRREHSEQFDLETPPGVDGDGPPTAPDATATASRSAADHPARRPGAPRAAWRAPLPWLVIAAVLVLLGVVVAERPASTWQVGMVPTIGTPNEQWFAPIPVHFAERPQVWVGDESVLVVQDSQVHGFGTGSGDPLWQVPGEFLRCSQAEPDALVACVSGHPDEAELIQVDAAQGEVTRTERPGLLAAANHDGDLLTVDHDGEQVLLQREDGAGHVRWSVDLGTAAAPPVPDRNTVLSTAGDYVLLRLHGAGDGERLGVFDANDGTPAQDVADSQMGRLTTVSTDPWILLDDETSALRYLTIDGTLAEPRVIPGFPLPVDDHLDSDVTVQHFDGTVYGHGEDTEEPLWTDSTGGAVRLLGRVDGTVLVHRGTHASALDEQTGELQWHERVPWLQGPAVSDGDHLLAVDSSTGELTLNGIEVATGKHVIEVGAELTPANANVLNTQAHGTNLAVLTNQGLTMWSLD